MAGPDRTLLIRDAELWTGDNAGPRLDVLVEDGSITRIAPDIAPRDG